MQLNGDNFKKNNYHIANNKTTRTFNGSYDNIYKKKKKTRNNKK